MRAISMAVTAALLVAVIVILAMVFGFSLLSSSGFSSKPVEVNNVIVYSAMGANSITYDFRAVLVSSEPAPLGIKQVQVQVIENGQINTYTVPLYSGHSFADEGSAYGITVRVIPRNMIEKGRNDLTVLVTITQTNATLHAVVLVLTYYDAPGKTVDTVTLISNPINEIRG